MRKLPLLLALAALAALPATASATHSQVSVIQDDAQFQNYATQTRALDTAKALGADYIRTLVRSQDVASRGWFIYDDLVNGARARGMKVLMTLVGPPYKPNVSQFQTFVTAVGARYRTSVDTWSIWNEPNLNGWLAPQGKYAAVKYRSLYRAGRAGLVASGNGGDRILLGELAPTRSKRTTAPVTFYHYLFCTSSSGKKLTGKAASGLACGGFKKLVASGVAHHPYTTAAACNPTCKGGTTDITIASLYRLATVLDQATRAGRLSGGTRNNIWMTEFGFQSNPPNRGGPVSLAKQATYINWGEYDGFSSGRVRSYAQYELVDPGAATFNTGLFRQTTLLPKPSLAAYRTPIFVVRSGKSHVRVFGGARPGGVQTVAIQAKIGSSWKTATTLRTNGAGYVWARLNYHKSWRITWAGGTSRTAGVVG